MMRNGKHGASSKDNLYTFKGNGAKSGESAEQWNGQEGEKVREKRALFAELPVAEIGVNARTARLTILP